MLTTDWDTESRLERHETDALPQVSLKWCRGRHPVGKGAPPDPIYQAGGVTLGQVSASQGDEPSKGWH